jgi:hypothetical protein
LELSGIADISFAERHPGCDGGKTLLVEEPTSRNNDTSHEWNWLKTKAGERLEGARQEDLTDED